MNVGDYVRNKYEIAKVIDIKNNNDIEILVFDKNICFLVNKEIGEIKEDKLFNMLPIIKDIDINKIKSSSNIIDLIEVGDYVNGELVVKIEKDPFIKDQIDIWTNTTTANYWGDISLSPIIDKDIKSIVTKEQFESMKYKVGE